MDSFVCWRVFNFIAIFNQHPRPFYLLSDKPKDHYLFIQLKQLWMSKVDSCIWCLRWKLSSHFCHLRIFSSPPPSHFRSFLQFLNLWLMAYYWSYLRIHVRIQTELISELCVLLISSNSVSVLVLEIWRTLISNAINYQIKKAD